MIEIKETKGDNTMYTTPKPKIKIDYTGYTVKAEFDEYDNESPRDWDNLGTMVCWHRRYNVGDEHRFDNPADLFFYLIADRDWNAKVQDLYDYWWREDYTPDEVEYLRHQAEKSHVILNVYGYDHDDLVLSSSPFSCPWDSGMLGYNFVSLEKVRRDFGWKRITKKRRDTVIAALTAEVDILNSYPLIVTLTDPEGNEQDSYGGYRSTNPERDLMAEYPGAELTFDY